MKNIFRPIAVLAMVAALIVSASAADGLLGVWHGRLKMDTSKLPKATDPNQAKQVADQVQKISQISITLTISKGGAFSLTTSGGPGKPQKSAGTWVLAADKLTMTPSDKKGPPVTFTLAKDSKTLTLAQGPMTVLFTR